MRRLVRFTGLQLIMAVVVTVFSMGLASQVDAVTILDTSSDEFLGSITPDGGSEASEAAQINHLISMAVNTSETFDGNDYVRDNGSCGACPAATAVGSVKEETSGDNDGSFGSGFTYLKAKYDAAQGGALVWYVAGLTGDFEVPSTFGTCGSSGCGISHWVLFNPSTNVSEPSTTLLLGLAFAGVAFFGRKFLART